MREVNIKNDSELWDEVWKRVRSDFHEDKIILYHEISSLRWRKIEKRILKNYRSFKVLDVIEIRVGRGENALLMGLKGANITILDYSEVALDKARLLFSHFNCKARFIKADVFDLPKYLMNSFDISMSFGLAEHFKHPQRQQIFNFHFILLKEKGISFISVPNAFCFPYRIAHLFLKLFNKFPLLEIPFTHAELKKNAYLAGYKSCEIVSSCFINAFDEFLIKKYIVFLC